MTHQEIRNKFLDFFEERGHKIVPSSSLLPTDPSVLFTTAGMQQFKPYYTGEADPMKDFGSLNTASIQKSIRTSDIDSVGDESHLTFFEMLGNFSFGDYWKKEAIEYAYEFITKEVGLKIDYVSIFGGANINEIFEFKKIKADDLSSDSDSEKIWKKFGVKIEKRVGVSGLKDNFWGPTGNEGPCGPTTEIYVSGVEIWNIVFNEYYCTKDFEFQPLETRGIDTGMGLERLAMAVQKKNNIFETDLFSNLFFFLPKELSDKNKRIVADHIRAVSFMIADGIRPSNKEQGYVLRRLIRRVAVHNHLLPFDRMNFEKLFGAIVHDYGNSYPELNLDLILSEFNKETGRFMSTLQKGLQEIIKLRAIDDKIAFKLYESYGLPYEVIREVGSLQAHEMKLTRKGFDEEFKKHQEKSRAGAEKKFGGHGLLLDTGELKAGNKEELEKVTRLHTATHLLHAALRKVLRNEVKQAGSDITAERLRFDFTFNRRVTEKELAEIEKMVNEAIKKDLSVTMQEMPYKEAIKKGALAFFKLKYPPVVKVYTIGSDDTPFSRELCGGPHITHTAVIGRFKIIKEESVSSGIRRIRATVE